GRAREATARPGRRRGGRGRERACCGDRGQRGEGARAPRDPQLPIHYRSFIRCPDTSACGSRRGLSCWSLSTGTPVLAAIEPSVSPVWTTYSLCGGVRGRGAACFGLRE